MRESQVHFKCIRILLFLWDNIGTKEEKTMNRLAKVEGILAMVVTSAHAVIALKDLWDKVGPDVMKVVTPVLDAYKSMKAPQIELPESADA